MGLSVHELMRIVEIVDFDFNKHPEGTTIINQGDRCDKLIYVLSGDICVDYHDADNQILVSEYCTDTPLVLQPENLWGMKQRFTHSLTFTSDGSTCTIDKRHLSTLISNYEVVKTNILSYVCNKLQNAVGELRQSVPPTSEGLLLQFLWRMSMFKNGRKIIRVKMNNLAEMLSDTRLNVSNVLNMWQEQKLVTLHRGAFEIHQSEQLFHLIR